jgi:hypothetical protein
MMWKNQINQHLKLGLIDNPNFFIYGIFIDVKLY